MLLAALWFGVFVCVRCVIPVYICPSFCLLSPWHSFLSVRIFFFFFDCFLTKRYLLSIETRVLFVYSLRMRVHHNRMGDGRWEWAVCLRFGWSHAGTHWCVIVSGNVIRPDPRYYIYIIRNHSHSQPGKIENITFTIMWRSRTLKCYECSFPYISVRICFSFFFFLYFISFILNGMGHSFFILADKQPD